MYTQAEQYTLVFKGVLFLLGGHVYVDSEEGGEDGPAMHQIPVHAKQGAPMKDWDDLGPLQKRRQSQSAFDEVKKAALARNVDPQRVAGNILHRLLIFPASKKAYFVCIRVSYLSDKKLAETGRRIKKGEEVQPKKTLNVNHSTWLCTVGAGFGQKQWRYF